MDCSTYEWATNEEFYGPLGLDYAYLYYCSFQGEHVLVLLAILLWVMFLMNLLADTATNYFSPTLGFICDKLNLSYDLAGVSFLAFGNGAPDFFALLASFSADIDILVSVGALLGGSVFICTVVAGCIAFLCPCEVSGRSFVRDVVFLLLAVGFVALAALIQEINLGFAFSFIIAYILYAVIVITTPKCFPPPPSENSPNLGNFAMTDFSGEDIQTAFWHRNVAGKSIGRKRGTRIIQPTTKLSSSSPSSLSTSAWGSGTMKSFSSLAAASAGGGTSGYKFLLLDDDDEKISDDKDEEKANFNSSGNGILGGVGSSGGGVGVMGVMEKQTINLSGGFIPEFDDIINDDFYSKDKGIDVVGDADCMEFGYKVFDDGSRIYTATTRENSDNNNKDDCRGARSRNHGQNSDDIGQRKQAFVNLVAGVDDCEVDATENRGTAGVLNAPNGVIEKSSNVSCQSRPDPSASSTGLGAESAHDGVGSGDHGYSYSDANRNGKTGNGKHSSGGTDPLSESLLPSGGEEEYDEEGEERMSSNTSSSTSTTTYTSTSFARFFNIRRIKKRHAHQYRRLAASLYWQQWAMQRRLRRSIISTEWWTLPTYQKLISVVFLPMAFLRDITIPTLDNENWSKPYALMHPFAMSIMIAYLFGYIDKFVGPFPVSLICVLASVGPAVAVFALTHQYKAPSGQAFTITWCLLAFGMCIIWTYVVAGELVTCLSVVGLILQLPPSFLGLTVLAWGNSLGDFFTNTAVARQGLGEMAIAGCFGGPVFNILMGLGLSLAYACLEAYPKSFSLQLDWSSMVSLIFLAIALTSSLVFAIMRNFQIDRSLGIYLLTLYVVYTVFQALLLVI